MYSNKRQSQESNNRAVRKLVKPNPIELEILPKPVNPLLQELGLSNLNNQLTYEQYFTSFKPKFIFPEHPTNIPSIDSNNSKLSQLSVKVDKFLESEWRFKESEFSHLWKF